MKNINTMNNDNKNDIIKSDKNQKLNKISHDIEKWKYENTLLWRNYLNSYIEKEKELERNDKFDKRIPAILKHFTDLESPNEIHQPYQCLPFNAFNLTEQMHLPNYLNRNEKIRIWQNMKTNPEVDMSSFKPETIQDDKQKQEIKWPGVWPCIEQDIAGKMRQLKILEKQKLKGLSLCQDNPSNDSDTKTPYDDFADHKELGHARIPKFCVSLNKLLLVDRSCGEHPGLVNGDYITFELTSENENEKRVYAEVCLRGMKGMHLIELNSMRARKKTWKFCFYQALVVLLAKTQLRYKYASSINIDYIYDHAWMIFTHIGSINIKKKHRFDDIVVYNYKYSVELELVQELKDIPKINEVNWKYFENNLRKIRKLRRPELMKTSDEIGWEKIEQLDNIFVHKNTENIEKWFDTIPDNYRNCIFRTNRFSLAFWNDGNFWYLYNPYRCDKYGFWDDNGYACIMKFCTKITLKRHLMILLLRAFVYKSSIISDNNKKYNNNSNDNNDTMILQIFQMIYHCVKIHNIKLLQRKPLKQHTKKFWKELDDCNYDPVTLELKSMIEHKNIENIELFEKPDWLKKFKISWTQIIKSNKNNKIDNIQVKKKFQWHQYYIEEIGKLFSLWSKIHPTGEIFTEKNRGKQIYACYIVCAGMTRIMAPEYWSAKILDAIVMCGDRYYTLSRLQSETMTSKDMMKNMNIWNRYLTRHFEIGEMLFEVDVLAPICGSLYTKNSLWKIIERMFFQNSFGILTCENTCLGIFKFCGSYYMFDVNSIGPPIFNYGDGVAYLIRSTSFQQFIVTLILTIGSIECSSFVLNPIDIIKVIDTGFTPGKVKVNRTKVSKNTTGPYDKIDREKFQKIKTKNKKTDKIICKSTTINE